MVVDQSQVYPWDNPFSTAKVEMAKRTKDAPDWLNDLEEKGVGPTSIMIETIQADRNLKWAIVKGVMTPEKAAQYRDRANDWLEGFGFGYKRDDPATWQKAMLPRHAK